MLQQAIKHLHLSAIITKLFTRYFPHMKCFIIKLKMEQQPSLSNASVKGKLFDLLSPQKLFHSQEKNFIQGEVLRLTGNSYTTIYLQSTLTFSEKRMERIYVSQINVSWTLVIVILEGGSQVSKCPDQISYNIFFCHNQFLCQIPPGSEKTQNNTVYAAHKPLCQNVIQI